MHSSLSLTSKNLNLFGRRLRFARLRLGLSQDKLGVLVGLDEHTASARISRYENGIHEPSVKTAKSLATALGVPIAYLYCEDNRLADFILLASKLSEDQWARLDGFVRAIQPSPT